MQANMLCPICRETITSHTMSDAIVHEPTYLPDNDDLHGFSGATSSQETAARAPAAGSSLPSGREFNFTSSFARHNNRQPVNRQPVNRHPDRLWGVVSTCTDSQVRSSKYVFLVIILLIIFALLTGGMPQKPNASLNTSDCTAQLILMIQGLQLDPPLPDYLYAQWETAAKKAPAMMPTGVTGDLFQVGMLVDGPEGQIEMVGPSVANVDGRSLKHVEARPCTGKQKTLNTSEDRLAKGQTRIPKQGCPILFPETGVPHTARGAAWACPPFYLTNDETNRLHKAWRIKTGATWRAESTSDMMLVTPLVFKHLYSGGGFYVEGTHKCQTNHQCKNLTLGDAV